MQTIDEIRHARFLLLLEEAGSVKALADRLEVSSAQVSQIKNRSTHSLTGRPRSIGTDLARKAESAFEKPLGWMDTPVQPAANAEVVGEVRSGARIPVVGTAQLGDNGHFVELEYPAGHGDGYNDLPSRDPCAYAVRCRGDSMSPRIKHGEYVIVEPGTEAQPGDEVLVKATDGRVMVKQFLYRRDGRVHLVSVNDAHPSIAIEEDAIESLHYVAAIAKSSRHIVE